MRPASATKRVAAFTIAIASALPSLVRAEPIPNFDLVLDVPGFPDPNVNVHLSPAPVIQAIDGTDGLFGSGSTFGRAQLGNLGAKATVQNTAPTIDVNTAAGSRAFVSFFDAFSVNFSGPIGSGVLSIRPPTIHEEYRWCRTRCIAAK